jgi:hypothetical protein
MWQTKTTKKWYARIFHTLVKSSKYSTTHRPFKVTYFLFFNGLFWCINFVSIYLLNIKQCKQWSKSRSESAMVPYNALVWLFHSWNRFETCHDKTNEMRSLIKIYAVHYQFLYSIGYVSQQHGSWSDCADVQAGLDPCYI